MEDNSSQLFGGIEGGGTKFVCAVGNATGEILAETRFPTTSPDETLARAVAFFKKQVQALGPLASIGVASFGPLDPRLASATFGHILPTPKPGWTNANIVGPLRAAFDLPIAFDTDVNGAALGEWRWGAAQGLDRLIHPEMGHILLPRDPELDPFRGGCPFHGDCFEGLASGPARKTLGTESRNPAA